MYPANRVKAIIQESLLKKVKTLIFGAKQNVFYGAIFNAIYTVTIPLVRLNSDLQNMLRDTKYNIATLFTSLLFIKARLFM